MKRYRYKELSNPSKEYAKWDIAQRNSVSKYRGRNKTLIIENCLFYSSGVFAKRIKYDCI